MAMSLGGTIRPRLRRRGVTSAAKRAANRRNARRSTGPRTAAGKARSARNARRHGLTSRSFEGPRFLRAAAELAQAIRGTRTDAESHACAMLIARAQVRLLQVRLARQDLYGSGLGWSALTRRLFSLFRHERRALSRRKFAIRCFDAAAFRQDEASADPSGAADAANFGQNEPTGEKSATISISWLRNWARGSGRRRRLSHWRWLRREARKLHNGWQAEQGTRRRYHRCC